MFANFGVPFILFQGQEGQFGEIQNWTQILGF